MDYPHVSMPLAGFVLVLALAPRAAAQLDLPPGTEKQEDVPREGPSRDRLDLPRRSDGDLAQGAETGSKLSLPAALVRTEPLAPPPSIVAGPHAAARQVLEELGRTHSPTGSAALLALRTLTELGEAGLAAGRVGLASDHGPTVAVCGRLLLAGGTPTDRARLGERLQARLPGKIGAPLLQELVRADPVLATPAFLAQFLDHPQAAVRQTAVSLLGDRPDSLPLSALVVHLGSSRTATRLVVLQLVRLIPGPAAENVLVGALGDRNARVAARAAAELAVRGGSEVEERLRTTAFPAQASIELTSLLEVQRISAYARLALVRREEQVGRPLFGDGDIPILLEDLRSPTPIVAGAAAVALAGIGFKSDHSRDMRWLDLEVPHTLVRLGTGAEFHPDFSALAPLARERLALLSGENLGLDGHAWRNWWTRAATGFHARRGALELGEGEASLLRVDYQSPYGEAWIFVGPAAATPASETNAIYLDAREAAELAGLLRAQGAFGAARLGEATLFVPGTARELVLRVRDQSKRIAFDQRRAVLWFATIEEQLRELARLHRWQAWGAPEHFASRRDFWREQHAWWKAAAPLERERWLKKQMLAELLAAQRERPETLSDLAALHAGIDIPEPSDFPILLELLRREPLWNSRARTIFAMARTAASTATTKEAREAGARIDPERGTELLVVLVDRFEGAARGATGPLLAELGPAQVRAAAGSDDPGLRRLAAQLLARSEVPEERALAVRLASDPRPSVAEAALQALGEAGVEEAREALVARASVGPPRLRAASLRALGRLGGDGVGDLALITLAERDPLLQQASVEALADLEDPQHASLLAAIFARGPDSILFEPAERGLLALGQAAHPELLRLTRSSEAATRRSASLVLASQGVAEAASPLMTLLTEDPTDARVLNELCVLTCIDPGAEDPVGVFWVWWDGVVHDDSYAWMCAAGERQGLAAPASDRIAGSGSREGARFCLAALRAGRFPLKERAARELGRLLDRELDVSEVEEDRELFLKELSEEIEEVFGG